jgi:hypothetical protein
MSRSLFDAAACAWKIEYGEETGDRWRAASGEGREVGGCGGQAKRFARKGDPFLFDLLSMDSGLVSEDDVTRERRKNPVRAADQRQSRRRGRRTAEQRRSRGRKCGEGGDQEKQRWEDAFLQVK